MKLVFMKVQIGLLIVLGKFISQVNDMAKD